MYMSEIDIELIIVYSPCFYYWETVFFFLFTISWMILSGGLGLWLQNKLRVCHCKNSKKE